MGLFDAMLGKRAGRAPAYAAEEVRGRVHELLQSPEWSRAWLAVLGPGRAGRRRCHRRAGEGRLGWLMGGFPWAHGRTIIPMRAAEWMQQGEDSREVSATDLQHCDWCGAGSLTMLKCGKCLVWGALTRTRRAAGFRARYGCGVTTKQGRCKTSAACPSPSGLRQRRLVSARRVRSSSWPQEQLKVGAKVELH